MINLKEEGDSCGAEECDGTMVFPKVQDCSCFISPPCSRCVENRLECNKCGWSEEEGP